MRFRRDVVRHVLFVCPCGASVAWGSGATGADVARYEAEHAPHGGLREARPGCRRRTAEDPDSTNSGEEGTGKEGGGSC